MLRPTVRALAAVAVLAVLASVSRPARAEEPAKPPDTPAGKQLAAWLKAYNSGQADVARRFIREHFAKSALEGKGAEDRHLDAFIMVYGDNRRLELVRIEKSADHEVVALVHS